MSWEAIGDGLTRDFADMPDLATLVQTVIRLLIAALLGGVLGWQREMHGKAAGMRVVLEAQPDFAVVGEAADGAEAVSETVRTRPDVVLLDARLPLLDGVETARTIKENFNPPKDYRYPFMQAE